MRCGGYNRLSGLYGEGSWGVYNCNKKLQYRKLIQTNCDRKENIAKIPICGGDDRLLGLYGEGSWEGYISNAKFQDITCRHTHCNMG